MQFNLYLPCHFYNKQKIFWDACRKWHMANNKVLFLSKDQHQNSVIPLQQPQICNHFVLFKIHLFNTNPLFLADQHNTLTAVKVMFIKCVEPLLVRTLFYFVLAFLCFSFLVGDGADAFTCRGAAPGGPPPPTWSYAGKWQPPFRLSDGDRMSGRRTS